MKDPTTVVGRTPAACRHGVDAMVFVVADR
jgi:hypothetical protein